MKIKNKQPLLWPIVQFFFKAEFKNIQAFTFGDTVYCPYYPLPTHVIAHEQVHIEQHRGSKVVAACLFLPYVFSKRFRLKLELPAFQAQVAAGLSVDIAAASLSSKFYGKIISYEHARWLLR